MYSIRNHTVSNIWDQGQTERERSDRFWDEKSVNSFRLRFYGTMGEIVFADYYGLPRPQRSFGAVDGQDYGSDFHFATKGVSGGLREVVVDLKTMRRNTTNVQGHYVLNIPERQVDRWDSLTSCYYALVLVLPEDIHKTFVFEGDNAFIRGDIGLMKMVFVGYVNKEIVYSKGIRYEKGSQRVKDNGNSFHFSANTFEVEFKDFQKPWQIRKRGVVYAR